MGDINTVGVIGAGQMGSGIAHVCALGGREVRLHDMSAERLQAAMGEIEKNLGRQVAKGAITEADAKAALSRITPTADAAQVQGVWVPPERRGEGIAVAGMAAVVKFVQAEIAPTVSLYVNEWNQPARRAYRRVGFRETARFSTVMF